MASFPTSAKVFASRSAGQTIGSAHINDLQDEVAALETWALTGPVTLPASTLASLSVTGGSTFAGNITATAQPRCMVVSSASFQIATTFSEVTFEQEDYDVGGLHSTAVNPSRITVPAGSSGLWMVGATLFLNAGSTAAELRLLKNSTTEVSVLTEQNNPSSGAAYTVHTQAPVVFDGGDYVEASVRTPASTGSLLQGSVRRTKSQFWAVKLW